MDRSDIIKALKEVLHPGKGDANIVDLGYVDSIDNQDNKITITLGFPKRKDPLADYLVGSARASLYRYAPAGTEIEVKTIIKEDTQPKKRTPADLGVEELSNVKHIIGIASGKGGVGKSTVAVNLAVALSRIGYKVGLADADVYGPSVPTMTGTEDALPQAMEEDGKELILPIEKYGIKWMSIGYFAKKEQALIWRGPMASNALKQMILQVRWGDLDFLLIDMPPGTGDIHISLVNDIPMEGAIIVTTPQSVALSDVEKGVNMFRNENVNKKVFGIVENMAWFTPKELPNNKYYIFGKNGGSTLAEKYGIELLGQIPLVEGICESGDSGEPCALTDGPDGKAFIELANKLITTI